MTTNADSHEQSEIWQRQSEESAKAYAAFRAFLGQGEHRTFVGTAKAIGRNVSLVRRWAGRYRWRERAWAWDQAQAQADAVTMRHERDEAIRRLMRDADHLRKLAMGKLSRLVHRDPATGELTLDEKVTPRMAVWFYKLGLDIEEHIKRILGGEAEATDRSAEAEFGLMPDAELRQIIALARERAQEKEKEGDQDDSQGTEAVPGDADPGAAGPDQPPAALGG